MNASIFARDVQWVWAGLFILAMFALCAGCEADARSPVIAAKVGGRTGPDGTELACDLPGSLHLKNRGGSDGAGLCVFASLKHSAQYQNVDPLKGIFEFMFTRPGGGYPSKVDKVIKDMCAAQGVAVPPYIQYEGTDLTLLKLACKTGRMPGVTYSFSPTGRYGGARIAHMVSLPHADDKHFVVLDNNYPGAEAYEWMTPDEFRKTWTGGRQGWAVILLAPPPPPPPRN